MITPTLEKLILCGKAFYKTFVAGGTKHTLNISEDRFIIITDITYFPMNCASVEDNKQNHNTQVAIYGERGYNHFIFRNYNNTNVNNANVHGFCSPVTINTFMLHEMQVGFSFCNAPYFRATTGIANTENPAYPPPIDYGKDGDIGAVPVVIKAMDNNAVIQNNFTIDPTRGVNESQQLRFPFIIENAFEITENYEYPLMIVNYVEVLGSANNIQI
jgi:hypothetical protein